MSENCLPGCSEDHLQAPQQAFRAGRLRDDASEAIPGHTAIGRQFCIRTRVCLALKPTVLTHVRPQRQIRMRNAEEGARSLTLLIYYIIVWMPQIQDKNLLAQASERCAFSRLTPKHMKHPETSPPPLPAMFAAHHLQTAEARLQVTCLNCWHDITLTYRLSISFSNSQFFFLKEGSE